MAVRGTKTPGGPLAALVLCLLLWTLPCPGIISAAFTADGYAELEYFPRFDNPGKEMIGRTRVRMNISAAKGPFRLKGWSEGRRNSAGSQRPEWELLVPEIFGEISGGPLFLRVGKQQIVWGAADGLFINDIVNPLDLREFLLPELENVRLGQPSARLQYQRGPWLIEGIWLWRFEPSRLPVEFLDQPPFPPGLEVRVSNPRRPGRTLGNTEAGLRTSLFLAGWDLSLLYFRSWRDLPTFGGRLVPGGRADNPLLMQIDPFYQRISTWGAAFSHTVGPTLVRAEISFIPGLLVETSNPAAANMVVGRDFLNYFVGADFRLKGTRIGFQFAREEFLGGRVSPERKPVDNVMTVLAERTFLRDRMHLLFFADGEFDQRDLWVRIEAGYSLNDTMKISLGSHLFAGRKQGRLGRLNDWSCFLLKFRYSFPV